METDNSPKAYPRLYHNLVDRILKGKGHSSPEQRRAAFNNSGLSEPLSKLIEKVAHQAYKVTDNDVEIVKRAGVSENELFELIVCAAVGQASRQYESGLAALAEAIRKGRQHAS